MSYTDLELSEYEGNPNELYEFQYGSAIYRYTSADTDLNIEGNDYEAVPINRGKIEKNQDIRRVALTITISRKVPFATLFIGSPPTSEVVINIKRFHGGLPTDVIIIWIGRIVNMTYEEDTVEIRCESIHTSIKRPALRRFYQANCPHVLYGDDCRASELTYREPITLDSVNGTALVSSQFSGFSDDYFTGGYIQYNDGVSDGLRYIVSHTGDTILINLPLDSLRAGVEILTFPGCDHTLNTCNNKFNNKANYGGFAYIPAKNPFGGSPIF